MRDKTTNRTKPDPTLPGRTSPERTSTDRAKRYTDRIKDLTTLIEHAGGYRDLAIYRAHQHGVPVEEIARLAFEPAAEVRRAITEVGREPDVEEWGDGPDWMPQFRYTV